MRKRKITIPVVLAVILVLLVLSIFFLITFSGISNIKNIEIKLSQVNCATESQIRNQSDVLGQNILFVKKTQVEKNLTEKFICLKNVSLVKNSFDKVTLEVTGRVPTALVSLIKIEDQNLSPNMINISTSSAEASISAIWNLPPAEGLMVDDQGVVFSKGDGLNLPRLLFWNEEMSKLSPLEIKIGKKIDQSIINKSVQILEKIKTLGIYSSEARIYSLKTLLINTNPKLIFSLEREIDLQLAALQLIKSKAKIGDEEIEMIDLRFDKPIIRYTPKKK